MDLQQYQNQAALLPIPIIGIQGIQPRQSQIYLQVIIPLQPRIRMDVQKIQLLLSRSQLLPFHLQLLKQIFPVLEQTMVNWHFQLSEERLLILIYGITIKLLHRPLF